MGGRVLQNDVYRVVLENTSDVESGADSVTELKRYMCDIRTCDIVYEKIVERVQSDRTRNPRVLIRALKVLKEHLVDYVPSPPVLESIDQFCCSVAATDPQTRKTLIYIRALVKRKQWTSSLLAGKKENLHSTLRSNSMHGKLRSTSGTNHRASYRESRALVQEAVLRSTWLISNHIVYRARTIDPTLASHAKSLAYHPVFNFFTVGTQQAIDAANDRFVIEQARIEERIHTVRSAKKSEEMVACKNAGIAPRRTAMQLFQFKYYNQQEPLVLSESELDQVIDAVVEPPEDAYETRLIASKILIKVLVDRFIEDGEEALQFLNTIVSDMIQSEEVETQLHAFNLLLNLSVHFHLWEEASIVEFGDLHTIAHTGSDTPSLSRIQGAQKLLYEALEDMIRMLLECEETSTDENDSSRVWTTALNCLLFWTTKDGKNLREPLSQLNIRFIPAFMRHTKPAGDFTHRHLVRMAVSYFYDTPLGLSIDQVEKAGDIFWVVSQYLEARSSEAQDNLFTVIYDYVVATCCNKKKSHPVTDGYLELLKRLNAPTLFRRFFDVLPPPKFVESIINYVGTEEQWKQYTAPTDGVDMVDRKGLRKLLKGFRSLAQKYLALSEEFSQMYEASVSSGDLSSLNSFLRSNRADNRRYAESWLFQLLVEHWLPSRLSTVNNGDVSEVGLKAEKLFVGLVGETREELIPLCHSMYISILNRLVVAISYQVFTSEEQRGAAASAVIDLLNEYLVLVLQEESLNDYNARKIFDIIWGFCTFSSVMRPLGNPYQDNPPFDSVHSLYVRGAAILPEQIKKEVHILVFAILFDRLTNKNYPEMRLAVLLVMMDKCISSPEILEEIGGIPFFRKLLASRDPAIAYHASRFLIDQLEAERPQEYKDIMSAFLNKAQQTNNETLVANSYLQIKALIRSRETGML